MEVPRAPNCAYALQRLLVRISTNVNLSAVKGLLGKRTRDITLVLTIAGSQNLRRVRLVQQEVDDVKEALKVAVLVVVADGDESNRHAGSDADGVLNIEVLSQKAIEVGPL